MSSIKPKNCQICLTISTKPEFNKNKIYQQLAAKIENSFANLVEFPSTNGSIIPAQQLHMLRSKVWYREFLLAGEYRV